MRKAKKAKEKSSWAGTGTLTLLLNLDSCDYLLTAQSPPPNIKVSILPSLPLSWDNQETDVPTNATRKLSTELAAHERAPKVDTLYILVRWGCGSAFSGISLTITLCQRRWLARSLYLSIYI